MKIFDPLYGEFEITSSVIISLIESEPMQRLKKINQFGIPDEYYHLKNYTRYEHSIGVMLLLHTLGASKEEQIAGLLHDVSHTAFSHVVDWVVGEGKTENFQDENHTTYIESTEIPQILENHGYSLERIVNYKLFSLLEQDLPDLCADRVDYSLRELPLNVAKKCVSSIINFHNKMTFKDVSTARLFASQFLQKQMEHWGGYEAVTRYRLFANILKYALEKNIIHMQDFWKDDAYVMRKMQKSHDTFINQTLSILKNKNLTHLPKSKNIAHKKFRFVDPLVAVNGEAVRLSTLDTGFKIDLEKAKKLNNKGIYIPNISGLV